MLAPAVTALPVTAMSVVEIEVAAAFKAISTTAIVSHSEDKLGILELGSVGRERGSARWRRSQRGYSYRYSAEGCDMGFHDFVLLGAHP